MERRIKDVKQETIDAFYLGFSLVAFYEKVAEEFQIPFNNEDRFDCTKIRIASNIREQWYKWFEKRVWESTALGTQYASVHVWPARRAVSE